MATVLLNALASTAGGGITYLRNVLPRLAQLNGHHHFIALVPAEHLQDYRDLVGERIVLETAPGGGLVKRLWWEQTSLRRQLKNQSVDVLVSLGNFALLGAPVPQILFNRNDLHFSEEFNRDLRARGLYREMISNRLKRAFAQISIKAARENVTPTAAFADKLKARHRTCDFRVIHFGFDPQVFTADETPLSDEQISRLELNRPLRRLLYVSHYNYFRNFETLIRALPKIAEKLKRASGEEIQLVLTTEIKRGAVYGGYDATAAAELIDRLGVRGQIAMLGAVPYGRLHHLYRHCDLYVCPSYSESFGHPLLEAMAAGLPVAAADLPVHHEICDGAAVYFGVFDEEALADACVRVLGDEKLCAKLRAAGEAQYQRFSWDEHVSALIGLVEKLSAPQNSRAI
jgi:glycosyltransferase involved in cell wall biosynthesis